MLFSSIWRKFPTEIETVEIGEGITTIGRSAFEICSSLKSIIIPDSVTTIREKAFSYCSSLTSVTIPTGVTAIEGYLFSYCSSLTSVTMSDKITKIGYWAFSNSSLTSIAIPDSVTTIGVEAFSGCGKLTEVSLGKKIETISADAFADCNGLKSVYFYDASHMETCNAFLMGINPKVYEFVGVHKGTICGIKTQLFFKNDTCSWEYDNETVTLKKGEKVSVKSLNEDDNLVKYAQGMTKLRVEASIDGTDDKNLFSNFKQLNELYSVYSFLYFKNLFFVY